VRRALAAALLLFLLPALAVPAAAQYLAFRGLGVRAGATNQPDQLVFGLQLNMGEFVPNLRFQPSFDLGVGDHRRILSAELPALYRWRATNALVLYSGAGFALGYISYEHHRDSDFVIAPMLAAGGEWPAGVNRLDLELDVMGGKLPGAKVVVGWWF
jgi:hypothetical protein